LLGKGFSWIGDKLSEGVNAGGAYLTSKITNTKEV